MNDRINSIKNFWRIVAFIIVLGLVSLLISQFGLAKQIPVRKNCEGIEIGMFRTQLALIPSPDILNREIVEGKIKAWETMVAICENVIPVTGTPIITPQFTPATPLPFTTGIFEGQPGAYFHTFEAIIENHWKGIINGNRVIVFAGAWVKDPNQGLIAVETAPSIGKAVWSYYPSATKSGALRIVDAKGSRLIIQQENDNKMLFFDVPSLSFVNSLDELVVPTTPTEILNTVQPITTSYPYPVP